MRRVLVLADVDLSRDARIQRQLAFLREEVELSCLCWKAAPLDGIRYLELGARPRIGLAGKAAGAFLNAVGAFGLQAARRAFLKRGFPLAAGETWDLILANDVDTLPLARALAERTGARILLDAHEYAPGQFEDSFLWRQTSGRYIKFLCERYLPRVDGMITVCGSIARLYAENYGVSPQVLTNAPEYSDLSPSPTREGSIRLIYHGAVNPNRRIENMFRVMDHLPERFSLTMMISNPGSPYCKELKALAGPRIAFVPPVDHDRVSAALNAYDLGLYLLEPHNTNQRLALPNKFFEFVQGRLAIAVGPSEEMAALVREHGLGVVAEDFSPPALAREIAGLTAGDIDGYKRNAHLVARRLSAEANKRILLDEVGRLL